MWDFRFCDRSPQLNNMESGNISQAVSRKACFFQWPALTGVSCHSLTCLPFFPETLNRVQSWYDRHISWLRTWSSYRASPKRPRSIKWMRECVETCDTNGYTLSVRRILKMPINNKVLRNVIPSKFQKTAGRFGINLSIFWWPGMFCRPCFNDQSICDKRAVEKAIVLFQWLSVSFSPPPLLWTHPDPGPLWPRTSYFWSAGSHWTCSFGSKSEDVPQTHFDAQKSALKHGKRELLEFLTQQDRVKLPVLWSSFLMSLSCWKNVRHQILQAIRFCRWSSLS